MSQSRNKEQGRAKLLKVSTRKTRVVLLVVKKSSILHISRSAVNRHPAFSKTRLDSFAALRSGRGVPIGTGQQVRSCCILLDSAAEVAVTGAHYCSHRLRS